MSKDRNKSKTNGSFKPDYAVPPGETLREYLATHEKSHEAFARETGLSVKMLGLIVTGQVEINNATAVVLGEHTELPARMWEHLEANYRLALAAVKEGKESTEVEAE